MPPRTLGLLILFTALSASSAGLLCHAQQAQPSAVVRYHFGDDTRWADPSFDDSSWPVAENDKWPMPPFNSDGFIWVRLHVPVRADASDHLAVRSSGRIFGGLALSDELYVNGSLVAREGNFPPHVKVEYHWDAISVLPPSAVVPGKPAVVVLRAWVPPWERMTISSRNIDISIDESRNLLLAQRAAYWADLYAGGLDIVLDVGIAILGFGMLIAWRWTGERLLLPFAWVMILQAVYLLAWNPTVNALPVEAWVATVVIPSILFELALVELNWTVYRLHATALKRLGQAAAVVWGLGLLILSMATVPGFIAHFAALALSLGGRYGRWF